MVGEFRIRLCEPKTISGAEGSGHTIGPNPQTHKQSGKPTTPSALAVNKQCRHQHTKKTAHGRETTAQDLFTFNRFHFLDVDALVC